ncbi:hypothetical protein U2F26_20650 [Micromonospora sp. 4G57]|uniref:Uncharacterized protein n=1 Tax=Micromonospora sicca TaxID=2202420 RepID=A0ABU5JDZ9_9ACTN|nr:MULTISPECIES: hypothetical protein [unclassified Micromonospora]MDZ5445118.1 hypothetical protein [Micromonospora sp. 4G57]MDZ5490763.1 hypothetical protein [Micromonospora sp. 4G53]
MVIAAWLAAQLLVPAAGTHRAIAVDGKTSRGSWTGDTIARHVFAAAEPGHRCRAGQYRRRGKTNEITRFAPLLDQLGDLGMLA